MKKFLVFGCFGGIINLAAAEEITTLLENGLYIGIGIANSQDKIDWSGSAVEAGSVDRAYVTTDFHNSSRRFNGQAFLGYKRHEPFFWAVECSLNLGKNKLNKTFDITGLGVQTAAFALEIEVGHDIFCGVKIGKTLNDIITPYISVGACYRKMNFQSSYAVDSTVSSQWLESGSSKAASKVAFVYGCGCCVHLDNKTDVRLEYYYKPRNTIDYTTVVDTDMVDTPSYPRKFQLKALQHCISLGISRTFCW